MFGLLLFVSNSQAVEVPFQKTHGQPVQMTDFICWSHIGFNTSFGHSESRDYSCNIPDDQPDWVVCDKFVGGTGVGRGANWSFSFVNPKPNDDQNPRRYRGVVFHLSAPASNNPLDQWTSNIDLYNAGIHAISKSATLQDRWDHGCNMSQ